MLIRWAEERDLQAWCALAGEVSAVFQHPADMGDDPEFAAYARNKMGKYEALTAVDYRTGENMGFISFSRTNNRISWFAVSQQWRKRGVGSRLLRTALRQLDGGREITVVTFREDYAAGRPARRTYQKFGFADKTLTTHNGWPRSEMARPPVGEKRGGSFHYRYPDFIRASRKENCPVCTGKPAPSGQVDIVTNDKIYICAEYPGQGRLFGKMYVMPVEHVFHFEDMPEGAMLSFMGEVQRAGRALRKVTGAEKINYEMHANSGAHLHIHLFPRYLDDAFPSGPIDYRITEPAPYESYEEFLWFVAQLKQELL